MHGRRTPDMTERELNQKIRTAVEHAAPDQLERILSSCDQTQQATDAPKKGALTSMTDIRNDKNRKYPNKKRSPLTAIAAVAATFALVIGGFAMTRTQSNPEIDSIILLDVNPSLSLSVDTQEIVRAVDARNDEAKDVLGTMDLTGTSLEVSVNALIGAMMQKGYLDDAHNSILVSVENKDSARGATLQQKVSQAITSAMHTDTMDAAVLSQRVDPDDGVLAQLAQTHNISMGKAALIQEVITQDPTMTFEKLAPLSINDIALIASSKEMTSQTVTQTGTASDKAYIGHDAALEKALAHAGVTASDAKRIHVEFDSDDGLMVYEVEFETTDLEYDYDINARTGEVVKHEIESRYDDDDRRPVPSGNQGQADNNNSGNQQAENNTNVPETAPSQPAHSSQTSTSQPQRQLIGEEAAKNAALAHAGINASDVTYIHCNLDHDDGIPEDYDVEFVVGDVEYDYEIDLYSGKILSSDREKLESDDRYDDDRYDDDKYDDDEDADQHQESNDPPAASETPSYIGENAAFSAALSHAGVSESNVREKEVKLDKDDGRVVYEIEWKSDRTEYDYEVDAITGQILKAEKDIDD